MFVSLPIDLVLCQGLGERTDAKDQNGTSLTRNEVLSEMCESFLQVDK
jgi:hypothetical protein